ncbi:hypothetical protein BCR33DRAFT_714957 [Rhizoclosmatium globosum]|uniref:Uncharacterized protein n=1 Tax=Rhizoclosmatium globosum TaxID=329046 RepID=A0A1Y2CLL1_9FUNG|nr:hypothetical protein BCR33DRAFT_714957 [Rhizoclosmatium globosum]|eukprot:ORY47909.1 hypothetical protein BCR33DRAFT_714957 [Rhizoclosmatium globosum]
MYTEFEKQRILDQTEKLGRKPGALRQWFCEYEKNKDLPPKPSLRKRITDGRTGLQLKNIIKDNPAMSIRRVVVPSKSTIHRFELQNSLSHSKR